MATAVLNQRHQKIMDDSVQEKHVEKTEIQQFFTGQTIFVTGGTGFLGKLLIEKLLRTCYDLRKIYVLVRVKKGKPESERFNEIFAKECFEPLKKQHPNFLEKVTLVNGDLVKPDVGLSEESKKIIMEEVTTIFHVAATVRFDQHLKSAAYINVRSVQDLLRMAKEMPQLKGFLYVSTAYSNCPRDEILEQFYEPPITADNLLKVVNSLDDETTTKITPMLLKEWPNGYVFTKAVAESVVEKEGQGLPVAVVRPGIVTVSLKEPVPGWIDNIYGVNGVVAGAGLGILRTMPAGPDNLAELVPVDFVISTIIAALWSRAMQTSKGHSSPTPIYNYVLSPFQKLSYGKFFSLCTEEGWDYPSTKAIWYMCFSLRPNPIAHEIALFFLHTIPAFLIDFILLCIGKKPLAVAGYKRVRKFLDVIAYFAKRDWNFGAENVKKLVSKLSPRDREIFQFDLANVSISANIGEGIKGGRLYLLKESLDTIPAAKRRLLKLQIAHYALCTLLLYLLFKAVLFIFSFVV